MLTGSENRIIASHALSTGSESGIIASHVLSTRSENEIIAREVLPGWTATFIRLYELVAPVETRD